MNLKCFFFQRIRNEIYLEYHNNDLHLVLVGFPVTFNPIAQKVSLLRGQLTCTCDWCV